MQYILARECMQGLDSYCNEGMAWCKKSWLCKIALHSIVAHNGEKIIMFPISYQLTRNSILRQLHTLMIRSGVITGRPTSDSFFVPQLSNHWSPAHSANIWITPDWVITLSILPSPKSTTGTLFILYLESSKSMVRNEFDPCKGRNGAHRKDPEISETCMLKR